jgi:hypothetical protein
MIEYKVLQAENPKDLEDKVKNFLSAGWSLHGNLIVTQEHNNTEYGYTAYPQYVQAMTI